jgi:DNA-binding MarR family transcriptional regulator
MAADRDDFGVLLSLAYVTFVEELRHHLQGYEGFSSWTGTVLRVLDDGPMSLRQLAERLGMTSAGALKIVDPMVEQGYVTRLPDPEDRRVRAIALTPRGRDALGAARAFHARFEAALADEIGETAARATRRALTAIAQRAPEDVPPLFRKPRQAV